MNAERGIGALSTQTMRNVEMKYADCCREAAFARHTSIMRCAISARNRQPSTGIGLCEPRREGDDNASMFLMRSATDGLAAAALKRPISRRNQAIKAGRREIAKYSARAMFICDGVGLTI